jgi:hypothetical protein
MKKLALVMVLVLAGCKSPIDDIINNKFIETNISAPPADIVGTWTGNNGPYLITMKIFDDGSGLSCSSWNDKNSVNKIKFSAGYLYFQDGAKMAVSISGGKLIGKFDYSFTNDVSFVEDKKLTNASLFCQSAFPVGIK